MRAEHNKDMRKDTGQRALFVIVLIVTVFTLVSMGYLGVGAAIEGRSAFSKLVASVVDVVMSGDTVVSEQDTLKKIEKRRKINENWRVPAIYKSIYNFQTEEYDNFEYCLFQNSEAKRTIVYFHGGSFMWQPLFVHYDFCRILAREFDAEVIMPIYPKAPTYGYADVMDWLYGLFTVKNIKADVFVGDSAGASIAISFAQVLADRAFFSPQDIIALSPCIDLSLSNPLLEESKHNDIMLNLDDLRRKVAEYVKDGDMTDPYVNPMYADYSVLGRLTVFTAEKEIFLPDVEKLDSMLDEQGIEHNLFVYRSQFHSFEIFPMPERRMVLQDIREVLV